MLEKFVAAFRGSLPKVESNSTSRNDCGTKNVARHVQFRGMLPWAIFPATCIATKLRKKL